MPIISARDSEICAPLEVLPDFIGTVAECVIVGFDSELVFVGSGWEGLFALTLEQLSRATKLDSVAEVFADHKVKVSEL